MYVTEYLLWSISVFFWYSTSAYIAHLCSLIVPCMLVSFNLLFLSYIVQEVCMLLNEVWYPTLVHPPTCLTESFLVTFAHKHATCSCYCKQKSLTKSLPRFYCQSFQAASSLDTIAVMFSYRFTLFSIPYYFSCSVSFFSLFLLFLCLCLLC